MDYASNKKEDLDLETRAYKTVVGKKRENKSCSCTVPNGLK
jgi:hypothetical protein